MALLAVMGWLEHLSHLGRQQGSVELTSALQSAGIDDQVGQRVESAHRAQVAHHGPLDAQGFGLTVDALGTGALVIDGVVEGALPIQQDAHASSGVPIGVFDTAFAFGKLRVVARLAAGLGKEQRTAKALGAVASRPWLFSVCEKLPQLL